jgi:hypothetical protein
MQSEPHDWNVPAPLRALLWWPPVAFVVAMLEPTAAAGTIAVAGGVLAALGALLSAIGRAVARRLTGEPAELDTAAVAATVAEATSSLTFAPHETGAPVVLEQRAA